MLNKKKNYTFDWHEFKGAYTATDLIILMRFILFIVLVCYVPVFSQTPGNAIVKPQKVISMKGLNISRNAFIKNIGQYGDTMAGHGKMGSIKYGYESNNMLVLFTPKGLMHLHRKIGRPSEQEEKELKRLGVPEEEIEQRATVTERVITMEWEDTNPDVEIIAEEETSDYHTYGLVQDKAYGYRKITYKNLYPGIDVIYHFTNTNKTGFEYSIILQPTANLALVKMKYGGDTKSIKIDKAGNLVINSGINGVIETGAAAFSSMHALVKLSVDEETPQQRYNVSYQLKNKLISLNVPGYDKTKTLVIDPFVSNTGSLTGLNSAKAKDIDFDYAGNVYVAGGGDPDGVCQLSKFDPSGVLLWTFSGTLATPSWSWGIRYGGFVVEKGSGNILIGQGYNATGTRIIRLSAAGVYDNYITNANPLFQESWKLFWSCNNGNPQILVAGGGVNSNINFGVVSPPVTTVSTTNITAIPTFFQDIADIVVDPLTSDMYTIFASSVTTAVNNSLFKNSAPYSASTIGWQVPSGYTSLGEQLNRPYLGASSGDNSLNALAVNSSYLYYWDGLNLKAFNKTNGTTAGTPLSLAGNTVKMQGGIIADECNNIFIGNNNGTIKVYKFDGATFNDAAAPDISIPGFPTAAVYDLAYDDARKLLYASGNGFVASFDISSYCTASSVFNLSVTRDCPTHSAQANVTPTPPSGTAVTYNLFVGTTQIAVNSTGLFTGLAGGTNYTVKAFLNQACSGIQLVRDFNMDNCALTISATLINPSCNLSNGSINASAISGTPPYQFSKDGINFQSSGIFTGLAAGNYSIIVKDAVNARDTVDLILVNSLLLQVTASTTPSSCTQNIGIITATGSGGAAPLKYSIDGINFRSSGIFTGIAPGNYILTVKDTNACITSVPVFVDGCTPVISATFINPSCNLSNGSIDAAVVSGRPPFQFTKDGINFQQGGLFTGLAAGNYSIIIKDANNLKDTVDIILVNSLPLQVTATRAATSCTQNDGVITATGSGGAAPLKYSIDGIAFGASGIFTGLGTGNYTISVKDTNACITSIPVYIDSLNTVFANTGNSVTICEGSKTTLAASSNGNSISWTPSTKLTDPGILTPDASPVITTLYTLTATTGICKTTANVTVFVNPAPIANAGRDTGICSGKDAQLNGSGGVSYAWTPATYLSAANLANPLVLQPNAGSITYHLLVTDGNNCTSLKDDAVIITVSPPAKLFVGNDTSIAINQPLRLFGIDVNNAGFNNYTWSPAYGLNNPFANDPTAILGRDIMYSVIASNTYGCSATDDIKIKVYEGPEIYVPNAFTPGGDGLNDVLRPIIIGMKEFHYFRVFDRYGQLLYTTSNAVNGWDGNFKGSKQPVGTYVWMAEAIDYRGNKIQRNGSVILIR